MPSIDVFLIKPFLDKALIKFDIQNLTVTPAYSKPAKNTFATGTRFVFCRSAAQPVKRLSRCAAISPPLFWSVRISIHGI